MTPLRMPSTIETFEIDGVIEVICQQSIDVASIAWIRYAAARRSGPGIDRIVRVNSALGYTSRGVGYEWRLYKLEEL